MRLSSIRIEQFRQFRQPIEIRDLEAGINLFTGPNEAGKSTIVAAIRAAFFERHRSGSVDALRPWGDAAASPTVELEFTVGDQACRLTKSFLGKKRCELQVGTRRLDGAEAEDQLARMLGFQYAGRGASAAEHWGIPGLLWIEQGAAHDIATSLSNATDHLRGALNESLGEIASSAGDEVLTRIEASRNELLTPAAGTPRGPYADAIKRADSLAGQIEALDGEIAMYRQKVDTLASLRREHADDERETPWVAFRAKEQEARDKLSGVERLQATLAADRQRANQLDSQVALLRGQLEAFARQEEEAKLRAGSRTDAQDALRAADDHVEQCKARAAQAARRHELARAALRWARQEDTRRGHTRLLQELRSKADATAVALGKAEAEQTALIELQAQAAASEIAATDLDALRERQLHIRELQIQREAAATRLTFTLADGAIVRLGSEAITGTGERLLVESTTLLLPGLGRLDISPGGADLADLGRRAAALMDDQSAMLARLGLASLDAAQARHQTHEQRRGQIKTAAATLKALAPKGLEALRAEHASHAARAGEIEAALEQLPPAGEPSATPLSVAQAEAADEAAREALDLVTTSLNQAQLRAGGARAVLEGAVREHQAAQALLDAPDRGARLAAARRALVDALAEQATLAAGIERLATQVTQARPDIVKQDAERFGKSAEQLQKRFADRQATLMRMDIELDAAGARGLDERRAEAARDHAQARRRADELRRRAAALDHLLTLLRAKRGALTRKLQAPLQKHLARYVDLLFPGAHLEIDADLAPGALTRASARGPESGAFVALSFGAREQMGVISRLAYADLLREAGRPTLIILDDALVHSDDERLGQMKRVLFDAATRHQILLFTCHPGKWRDLGVGPRSLAGIRGVG